MEKLIYLLWRPEATEPGALRDTLLEKSAPALLDAGVRALNVSVADLADSIGARGLVMGDGPRLGATVSLWLECCDDRAACEAVLGATGARQDGYLVTESLPQPCRDRDWPDGARSPGVTHFTWFPKPEGLSDEQFYRGWHDEHTPLSFELHPLRWEYVRNSVARTLTTGSPPIRAIVAERFRTLDDYTDPARLYGGKEVLQRMMDELPGFADVTQMHSVPLSEYIVKSGP